MSIKHFLLTLFCLVAINGYAAGWKVSDIPSPKRFGQDFYVSNPDDVLSEGAVARLNEVCRRLNDSTGVELAVVAVDKFDEERDAYFFALELFNTWEIGRAETNTGVLLFLAEESRDVQIITGDGIAGILTDGRCGKILDDNLKYLKKNDFDNGTIGICLGIERMLMWGANRSQLYLGWSPEPAKLNTSMIAYFAIGFVLMLLLGWWGYRKLQGRPGMKAKEIDDEAYPVRLVTGILMLFFPMPLLLFYIFYRILCSRLKDIPPVCAKCGRPMELLSKEDGATHLTPAQQFDEQIDSFQHEVWQCKDCGSIEVKPVNGMNHYKYDPCPKCGANAMETTHREVLSKATDSKNGQQKNTRVCLCCGFTDYKILKLKKDYVTRHFAPDTDEDGFSSRSGGGRSGSGGGSWGGGHSSGGGAGRRF